MKKILLAIFIGLALTSFQGPTLTANGAETREQLEAQATRLDDIVALLRKEINTLDLQANEAVIAAKTLRDQAATVESAEAQSLLDQAAAMELLAQDFRDQAAIKRRDADEKSQQAIALWRQIGDMPVTGSTKGDAAKTAAAEIKPQTRPQYKLIVPIPGFQPENEVDPLKYIVAIYNVAIAAGGLIAMAIIVFGGLKWATSSGNPSNITEAKDLILHAVYGLIMLIGATLILYTIGGADFTKLTLEKLSPVAPTNFDFTAVNLEQHWKTTNEATRKTQESYDKMGELREAEEKASRAAKDNPTLENKIAFEKAKIARLENDIANANARLQLQEAEFKLNCPGQEKLSTDAACLTRLAAMKNVKAEIQSKKTEIINAQNEIMRLESAQGKVPGAGGSR